MSESLGILVEAKKEYLGQLSLVMYPSMIEVFSKMYDEANKLSKGRKVLIMFQKLLQEVKNWSDTMSKSHSETITSRCAWFGDLLAAVFVSCVKILSSVRLRAENKKISLKVPKLANQYHGDQHKRVTKILRRNCTRILIFSMKNS